MESLNFAYGDARMLLARTPATIRALVDGLPDHWLDADEGPGTWSPRRVVGHLILCDRRNWMPRLEWILQHGAARPFEPFNQAEVYEAGAGIGALLTEFESLRAANLARLEAKRLAAADFDRSGLHPTLGLVTLRQLVATWAVHDSDHLVQISRVIAKRYTHDVGPWRAFLNVLGDRPRRAD
ncbi:MAG: DinB family protein [Vicinamibacteria bacterium]|nr:DinB family protein [Vicinamibacteria bacterium]